VAKPVPRDTPSLKHTCCLYGNATPYSGWRRPEMRIKRSVRVLTISRSVQPALLPSQGSPLLATGAKDRVNRLESSQQVQWSSRRHGIRRGGCHGARSRSSGFIERAVPRFSLGIGQAVSFNRPCRRSVRSPASGCAFAPRPCLRLPASPASRVLATWGAVAVRYFVSDNCAMCSTI
jgi:hypothetical protein